MTDKLIEAVAKALAKEAVDGLFLSSMQDNDLTGWKFMKPEALAALSAIEASGYAVMQKETMLAMIALTTEMAETLTYILNDVEPTEFALSSVARDKALAALAKARGED